MKLIILFILMYPLKTLAQSTDTLKPTNQAYNSEQASFVIFFNNLKTMLTKNDSLKIANQVFYPLHAAYGKKRGSLTIYDKRNFLKLYHNLLDERMKKFIISQTIDSVTFTYKGIFMGHGRIWIDQRLSNSGKIITKIMTINNSEEIWYSSQADSHSLKN